MKIKIILIVLLTNLVVFGQTWQKLTEETIPNVSAQHFFDMNTGWICSASGQLFYTTNGGSNWIDKSIPNAPSFVAISFVDQNNGYVAGNQVLYKTTDGGQNWVKIELPSLVGNMIDIHFKNASEGWAATSITISQQDTGRVFKTTDGGATFTKQLEITTNIQDMEFKGDRGMVCGGGVGKIHIHYTHDGQNWQAGTMPQIPAGYTRTDIRGLHYYNDNIAFAVGWGSLIGMQPSILMKTTDGGVSWTYLTQQPSNRVYDNMYGIYFKDTDNGLAFGGATRGTVALRTVDGGVNWVPIDIPCGITLRNVHGEGNNVLVSGASGVFMKSTDFGDTWSLVTEFPGTSLYSLSAAGNKVLCAGFNAVLLKSTNNGYNWKAGFVRANGVAPSVNGIFVVNQNVAYAAHGYGLVSKTTDGGETWFAVIPDTTAVGMTNYAPFFLDENYGYIAGRVANNEDIIYRTTDGGANWTTKKNILASNPRGIAFFNQNKGIIVGEKLRAAYTNDGGTTWELSTFSDLPPGTLTPALRDVRFVDENKAFAVGESIILVTTDGGASWKGVNVVGLVQTLTGIDIYSSGNFISAGSKSSAPRSVGLYISADGGVNWFNQANTPVFDTLASIGDVVTTGGHALVCAARSIIYSDLTFNEVKDNTSELNTFYLSQNYPNPFNPATRISYYLPVGGKIRFEVYDLLGNLVRVLVDKEQDKGNYTLDFNAGDLASGVYIYQIKTNQKAISKKMLLIK